MNRSEKEAIKRAVKRAANRSRRDRILNATENYYIKEISKGGSLTSTGRDVLNSSYRSFRILNSGIGLPKTEKGARTFQKEIKRDLKRAFKDTKRTLTRAINRAAKDNKIDELQAKKLHVSVKYGNNESALTSVMNAGKSMNSKEYYEENKDFLQEAKETKLEYQAYEENGIPIPAELQNRWNEIQEAGSDIDWISDISKMVSKVIV